MSDQDTDAVLAEMQKQTEHLRVIRQSVVWLLVIALAVIAIGATAALAAYGS